MPTHCSTGDKPIVYYRFENHDWSKIQINAAPISVSLASGSSQISQVYTITTTTPLIIPAKAGRVRMTLKTTYSNTINWEELDDTKRKFACSFGASTYLISENYAGRYKFTLTARPANKLFGIPAEPTTINITLIEDFAATEQQTLTIKYENNLLFEKSGKKGEYKVVCGEECPPGFLKCPRPDGSYYCMPDSQIKSHLAHIKSLLRSR